MRPSLVSSTLFVNDHQDIRSFLHCFPCPSSRPSVQPRAILSLNEELQTSITPYLATVIRRLSDILNASRASHSACATRLTITRV